MEANFWHQRWESGKLGFHEGQPNALLVKHFKTLNLTTGSRILLPLCGKTRDIAWLLSQDFQVVGVELSELAVTELFEELDLKPDISNIGDLILYSAKNIDIIAGDIFNVSAEILGPVNAIYDRAALVTLPIGTRERYVSHLINITGAVPQLLICFDYQQALMEGPPFSINESNIRQYYDTTYQIQLIESKNVAGGLKGKVAAMETIW